MNTVLVVERHVGALFSHKKGTRICKVINYFMARKATSEDTTALFRGEIPKKMILSGCVSENIVFLQAH
ncbi:hypothetical protein [Kordia jejudonensis]|uniref:hypothetical protein n=1 Tax=Kordia jejudonensis TaxID=1348245 RepID=UPI000629CA7F|nr:hypothetical protein [Kordia jejudonensis]